MRFTLLTFALCAFVTALPREGGEGDDGWDTNGGYEDWKGGKHPYGGGSNDIKVKNISGGTGGGVGGNVGIGVGGGGGNGGNCDPVACDIKCKKLGDQSGYCDTSGSSGVLGIDVLGDSQSGCICVPNTGSCTTTATATLTVTTSTCSATSTTTATATTTLTTSTCSTTDTITATNTITSTDTLTSTNTITSTDTITSTNTLTSTNTITQTSTTTTTATSCPTVACFCCTNQTQLGSNKITGTCDTINNSQTCPVGNGEGRNHRVCCDGNGTCTQLT
ncbi:hypothetical protein N7540_000256 [Penicillium herquei]|nr:hypothetical protein N7540_000256 [Penicillium herquei]